MRAILIQQGLDGALDNEEDQIGKKEKSEGSSSLGGDMRSINKKAHSTIILHLSDEVLREEGTTMKNYLDEFNKLILDLENVNINLEDEDIALILLSSLPDSYEHFVDTLLYGRQTLTLKDVKSALESKDLKKRAEGKDQGLDEGLMAKLKPEKKKNHEKKGCSFHMSPNKQLFKTFEKVNTGTVDQSGCSIKAKNGELQVTKNGIVIMKGIRRNGLYVLIGSSSSPGVIVSVTIDKTKLWHIRLAHMSENGLKELGKEGLISSDQISSLEFCEKCVFGKATRQRFGTGKQETNNSMDYIHSDLWGPSQVLSHGGARKVKRLRTDNGLEYCSKEFDEFCKEKGIARHKTVRHTPQQNGLAKRMNRTLVEKVRCMLFSANLLKHFWAEAVTTSAYMINKSLSSALNFRTSQEVWSGKPPDLSHMRIFSSPTYAHINQGKLEPRAIKGIFIGYPEGVKGYRIWCIDGKPSRIIMSRDDVFDEGSMLQQKVETELITSEQRGNHEPNPEVELTDDHRDTDEKFKSCDSKPGSSEMDNYQLAGDRERRVIKMPKRFGIADLISYALNIVEEVIGEEPSSYKQAMNSRDKSKRLSAMEEEISSLKKNNTWTLVRKQGGRKLVGCKWIFKYKDRVTSVEPPRYKARLVAKGFTQRKRVDYSEVFSPVVKYSSIRVLLAIITYNDLELDQMDVKTAFLHGNLEEEIYMEQQEGFIQKGSEDMFLLSEDGIYLLFYVDDMLIACKHIEEIEKHKSELRHTFKLSKQQELSDDTDIEYMKKVPYSSVVGRIMDNNVTSKVIGYVDSDFTGDLDKRKSTTGFIYTMCGGAVSWKSSLQLVVALSTTEAEYIALAEAVKEAKWLRRIISELGLIQDTIPICCDSSSAIQLSRNSKYHERTKYVDVKLHFIREKIERGVVDVVEISTEDNPADALTKPIPTVKFRNSLSLVGVRSL
ncbi:retrovirus-related pol polyprotein from transposon TNT 1-94-like protein [Citrus sinensis]|nr:retrovirus-related pol polyprotein from transposon TNT 1-94-like protein [Citrus sinensis]